MKLTTALFLLCLSARAATTINSISTTATQALVSVTRPTASPLTAIKVSEDPAFGTVVDDTNPAVFTGADLEAAHVLVSAVSGSNTILILRMGLRTGQQGLDSKWHSRAYASATHYYISLTGDATATSNFTTGITSGINPEGPPTDANGFAQLGNCEYTDFTKPCIEPHSGMKIYSSDPNAWGSSAIVPIQANWFTGGTGWTNASNITSYSGTGATTGNTNPLSLFLNVNGSIYNVSAVFNFGGYWPYTNFNDLALDLYGIGSDASGTNRTVRVCLSLDSGQTCFTPYVTVVLPPTTPAAAGTAPSTYPLAYFASWGGKALPRAAFPREGYVSASAGVVTLTQAVTGPFGGTETIGSTAASVNAYFDPDTAVGTKMFIAGSGGTCTNNFCTVASVQNATQLTLVENLTLGGNNHYYSAGLAAIVNKTNSTGTVTFSARWKVAQSYPQGMGTGGCALTQVTASDGLKGFPCIFPTVRQETGALYLMGTSGTGAPQLRLISQFPNNGATNANPNDWPYGAAQKLGPTTPQFDDVDPSKMYIMQTTAAGRGLFKVQYNATGTSCGGSACGWLAWTHWNTPYRSTSIVPTITNELTWTNLTPSGGGLDLRAQILANTTFNEALWGSAGNLNTAGLASPYMILYNLGGSQDGVCWIHAFTAATGVWYKSWRSDDPALGGQNLSLGANRYAGCHGISPVDGSSAANGAAFLLATHVLNAGGTPGSGPLEGGPFTGTITAVKKLGVYSANTSLPWPPDNTVYDTACPGGLPAWIVARGAINDQCVQFQGMLPCNSFAGAAESAAQPCPYNSAWGWLGGLQVGDFSKDNALGYASEGFMMVTTPVLASGSTCPGTCIYNWTAQRNANFSYCTNGNSPLLVPPKNGVGNPSQNTHTNGWGYNMVPRDSCDFPTLLLVDITGNAGYAYNTFVNNGHGDTTTTGPQTASRIASGSQLPDFSFIYNLQNQRAWSQIWNFNDSYQLQGPKFAGVQNDQQQTQSYVNCKAFSATALLETYCNDFSHYDPAHGQDLEAPGQTVGGPNGLVLQGGTTGVYLANLNGTPDIKHQNLNVWAGRRYWLDISSAATGNQITDAKPYTYCLTRVDNECRTGSTAGQFYISAPVIDTIDGAVACWQSQINLSIPCLFYGPTQGGQARRIYIGSSDGAAQKQSYLGWLGMTPGAQYVYSNFVPTPDGLYGIFTGYQTNGYHTGLMMAKLPPPNNDSVSRSTFVPVNTACPTGTTCVVEFGYEEYGSDRVNKFYCTTRAENCRVAASAINEPVPFSFVNSDAAVTPVSGPIQIPALPNHVLLYRLIVGGLPQAMQVAGVQ